jgi:galactoside O-acetyltransferase
MVGANSTITKDLEPWGVYIGNKRVRERNKEEVLKNYDKFLKTSKNEKLGTLFK